MNGKIKYRRGKIEGLLSAKVIAQMLGLSERHTRRLLKQALVKSDGELTLSDVGNLIYEYKTAKAVHNVHRLLGRISWM